MSFFCLCLCYLLLIFSHPFLHFKIIEIDTEIVKMFMGMSAVDRKWLTRILLKKLKLGIGDKRLLELYNPRAYDLYVQCNHLTDVCKAIESNAVPQDQPSNEPSNEPSNGAPLSSNGLIQIFRPLRSMLCERGYISQINQVRIHFRILCKREYFYSIRSSPESNFDFLFYNIRCLLKMATTWRQKWTENDVKCMWMVHSSSTFHGVAKMILPKCLARMIAKDCSHHFSIVN